MTRPTPTPDAVEQALRQDYRDWYDKGAAEERVRLITWLCKYMDDHKFTHTEPEGTQLVVNAFNLLAKIRAPDEAREGK